MQHLLRLCTGINAYALEHRALKGNPTVVTDGLVLVGSGCALEYDFCADTTGYLQGTGPLTQRLRELGMYTLLQVPQRRRLRLRAADERRDCDDGLFRCASIRGRAHPARRNRPHLSDRHLRLLRALRPTL
jgi:hypothetical protein